MTYELDAEEREILERFEQDGLCSAPEAGHELELSRQAARNTLAEWREVTLRVTEQEYRMAHARAAAEGVPCPTLLSGIIHKYLSGRLVEKA